jgi:hypothetical protein
MHVLKNVKGTTLIIARNVHKHVVTAPENVEEWQDRLEKKPFPSFF